VGLSCSATTREPPIFSGAFTSPNICSLDNLHTIRRWNNIRLRPLWWDLLSLECAVRLRGSLFFGISSGLLAFGLTRENYTRLWIFLAYPYWAAMVTAQWSPLIAASAFFWWLLPVVLIKPPIALPVALTHLSRRGIIACVAWLGLSFAITPRWFGQWTHQLGGYHYFIPFLVFPGILILLAFLRLGNDDARLLLLAAAFPQRWFYDAFVLWLIPKSRREIVASIGASWLVGLWRWFHPPLSFAQVGRWSVVGFYLPMLAIILLRHRHGAQSLPLPSKP